MKKNIVIILLIFLISIILFLILPKEELKIINEKTKGNITNDLPKDYKFKLLDFYSDNNSLEKLTNKTFNDLDDGEKISQMIISSAGKNGKTKEELLKLIQTKKIGGIVFLGGDTILLKNLIKEFNNTSISSNSLPLLYSTDGEPSLINLKIYDIEKIEPTNTIKSISESKIIADKISGILKNIGINQNYSPVCDYSYNKDIIGNRSFGTDEKQIIDLAKEFINITQQNNIIATAKHFPGHGNVFGDSHKQLVFIDGEIKELNIFKSIIKDSVISVMLGHIAIKNNIKYNTEGLPSSLSRKIVTDLLKSELGFKGLVITDGMNMKAVNDLQSPSLKAIMAGCDLILMPSDENKLLNSVLIEMKKNENLKLQIYESVKKIIRVKICLGLIKKESQISTN